MRTTVSIVRHDLVRVELRPSWLERLLGAVVEQRYAEKRGGVWCWDDTGRLVGFDVARAIDAHIAERTRRSR